MMRHFFDPNDPNGSNEPFLLRVATWLIERYVHGGRLDLSKVLLVFPSRHAKRRLKEHLVAEVARRTDAGSLLPAWSPPESVLVGEFPERLYTPKRPFTNRQTEQVAWTRAMERLEANRLQGLFPRYPDTLDVSDRMILARELMRIHDDVSAGGLSFADVKRACENNTDEQNRWDILAEWQDAYLNELNAVGLWDTQTARRVALEQGECRLNRDLILIGTLDLNVMAHKMLDAVAPRVTAWIFALETMGDRFDTFGSVIPEAWSNHSVAIPDKQIIPAEDPLDEAVRAAEEIKQTIQALNKKGRTLTDLVVGVLDDKTAPLLLDELEARNISARRSVGEPLASNRVMRLLAHFAEWMQTGSFEAFAALLRHPDWEASLRRHDPQIEKTDLCPDFLTEFDRLQNQRIPIRVDRRLRQGEGEIPVDWDFDGATPSSATRTQLSFELMRRVVSYLTKQLAPTRIAQNLTEAKTLFTEPTPVGAVLTGVDFDAAADRLLPPREWGPIFSEILAAIYPEPDGEKSEGTPMVAEQNRQIEAGRRRFSRYRDEMAEIPAAWGRPISAGVFLEEFLRSISEEREKSEPKTESVELIGWLDLALDDTPELFVLGFNDGKVPASIHGSPFLPDGLRRRLGLEDSVRRRVRDAAMLTAIVSSRPTGRFFFSRHDLVASPLLPSPFLLTGEPTQIAERILRFFSDNAATSELEQNETPPPSPGILPPLKSQFAPPILNMTERFPESLSQTDFKEFLASPYLWFLKRKNIQTLDDRAVELGADRFGTIVHRVLEDFGKDESIRKSTDAEKIEKYLEKRLEVLSQKWFDDNAAGAVSLQLELIRWRLRSFAKWQAAWRKAGNEIEFVEQKCSDTDADDPYYVFDDGTKMVIRGKIDRIDFNPKLGVRFLFDYKTLSGVKEGAKKGTKEESPGLREDSKLSELGNLNLLNFRRGNTVWEEHLAKQDGKLNDKQWKNLQLPLYLWLFESLQKTKPLTEIWPGYIVLPKSKETQCAIACWTREELAEADKTVRWAIRQMRRLWDGPIDPNALIDPEKPELGKILSPARLLYADDFAPITGVY